MHSPTHPLISHNNLSHSHPCHCALLLCPLYCAPCAMLLVLYPFVDVAEVFVRELIEDGVQRMVKEAGREDDERRLMALEDEASRRRREEDDRLNAERLRLLS